MSLRLYKDYLALLEKWPLDKLKEGRDLAQELRRQFRAEFTHGERTNVKNLKESQERLASWKRLCNNEHLKRYPRAFSARPAANVKVEHLPHAASVYFMKFAQQENKPNLAKFMSLWENQKLNDLKISVAETDGGSSSKS